MNSLPIVPFIGAQTQNQSYSLVLESLVLKIIEFLDKEESIPLCFKTSKRLIHRSHIVNVPRSLLKASHPWHYQFIHDALENGDQQHIDWLRALKKSRANNVFPMITKTLFVSGTCHLANGVVQVGEKIITMPSVGMNGFVEYSNSDLQNPCTFPHKRNRLRIFSFTSLRKGGFATVGDMNDRCVISIWDHHYNFVKEKIYHKKEIDLGQNYSESYDLWIAELENEKVVAGSKWYLNRNIQIWDVQSDKTQSIEVGNKVYSVLALPDNQIALGGKSEINVWDLSGDLSEPAPKEPVRRYQRNPKLPAPPERYLNAQLTCLASFGDGRLISGDNTGSIRVWNEDGFGFMVTPVSHYPITSIIVLAGKEIFIGDNDGLLEREDLKNNRNFSIFHHKDGPQHRNPSILWLKEFPNRHLVSCSIGGEVISSSVDAKAFIDEFKVTDQRS